MKTIKSLTEAEIAELPTLPDEWRWVRIGDLTSGVEYGTSSKSEKVGQVPVLRMGNIQNGRFDWSDLVYTSNKAEIEKYLLKKNDILFNRTNSPELVGKTAIYKGERPAIFAGYLIRVNQLPELVVADYLNYFLNCPIAKVHGNSVKTDGVNQSNINGEKLRNYPFPFPPLPEQRAIVSKIEQLFSELDNGISNLKLAQEQLKIYRQAVLKKAFEGELTKKWREQQTDLPDVGSLLEQIKNEREKVAKVSDKKQKAIKSLNETELAELPKIPEEWKWVKTADIIDPINNGYTPKANFLSSGSGEVPFIKVYNLNFDGSFNFQKDPTFIPKIIHQKELERSVTYPGDVLINIVGPPLGKVSIVSGQFPEWNINQAIVLFRPNKWVTTKLISYYLQNSKTIQWLKNTSKATAGQFNVKVSTCREIPFPLFSIEEQQAIVQEIETRLSVCDKIEQDIKDNLERAEALRQSILKKAFEGKLLNERELAEVRKAEDWEPAEVLLERIMAERARK